MLLMDLTKRNQQPEVMDQADLEVAQHQKALRGLARINLFSASDAILWGPIRRLARERNGQTLRILDIATGAGDIPLRLHHRAKHFKLPITCAGVDISPTAITHAREQAFHRGAAVDFFPLDVLNAPLPTDYDVLTCSLFLHHLRSEQAVDLLRRMREATRCLVLVNDLIRSRRGYLLAWLGTRVLTSSSVVHVDGPRSVAGAFTIPEARSLAQQAGMSDPAIDWRWPFRFLLQWRRQA